MYANPLSRRNFPDPFVLKWNGRYYAYATGDPVDGRVYGMMVSDDLVRWVDQPGALIPLDDPDADQYWAPEVCYSGGIFYMYYSVIAYGTAEHHLRVATSASPLGPFADCGVNLTPGEIFAIDAHPFQDEDGQWYLFYARDYLEPPFVGTGLAVDRLVTMTELSGSPARVLRPYAEWQLYEKERAEKGGMDWYTAEGAFVLPRAGRYLCLYSGGAWQYPNYGVAYATSDVVMGSYGLEDRSYRDELNVGGPLLLRTIPSLVLGPGHNSVVRAPNNVDDWLVYHGWDAGASHRMLRIDRLFWHGNEPFCCGASHSPQTEPALPFARDLVDRADANEPGELWQPNSGWGVRSGALRPIAREAGPLLLRMPPLRNFILEVSVRVDSQDAGASGIALMGDGDSRVLLHSDIDEAAPGNWRLLRLEKNGALLRVSLDGRVVRETPCSGDAVRIALIGTLAASFCGFEVTPYYEARELPPLDVVEGGRWGAVRCHNLSDRRVTLQRFTIEQRDHQCRRALLPVGDALHWLEISADLAMQLPLGRECSAGFTLRGPAFETRAGVSSSERGWHLYLETEGAQRQDFSPNGEVPSGRLRLRFSPEGTQLFWNEELVRAAEQPAAFVSSGIRPALETRFAAASFSGITVVGLPDP